MCVFRYLFFFFKQKTAYEMRISDWSSDVCSSDLASPDKTLNFLCSSRLLALRRLAGTAGVGGAGEHAIFRGDPAPSLAAQERRHLFLDAGGHQHFRVHKGDEDAAFGIAGKDGFERNRSHSIRRAAGRERWRGRVEKQ